MTAPIKTAFLMLLTILALLGGRAAHASFPATQESPGCTSGCFEHNFRNLGWFSTPAAACAAGIGSGQSSGYGWATYTSVTESHADACRFMANAGGTIFETSLQGMARRAVDPSPPVYSCPANSTLSGSNCTCSSGYIEQGSSCIAEPSAAEAYCASLNGSSGVTSAPRPPSAFGLDSFTTCYANQYSEHSCSVTLTPDICGGGNDGRFQCTGSIAFSASVPCSGTETPTGPGDVPASLPEPLPPGMCPGEVNGVAVNVPCGTTTSKQVTTKATSDSSGNTGSETKTRETTCSGAGSCTTTTTTTTTVNGVSTTKIEGTTQPKGEFCKENAGAKECDNGSSFAGNCDAPPVCKGDAVQCAQAVASHKLQCAATSLPEEVSTAAGEVMGEGMPAGVFIDGPSLSGPGSMPSGGSCPLVDQEIAWLEGHTITFSISRFCPHMETIRAFLSVFGALAFALIVFRG